MTDFLPSIPFLNLTKINRAYDPIFKERFSDFVQSGVYVKGKAVADFERDFAAFCGAQYCIGVGNGLDALTLILKGYIILGAINPGDEVLVAANTFIATILSIKQAGLTPILIEPDHVSFTMNPYHVENYISDKTRVLLPTHLYGQLAAMTAMNEIAKKHNLLVISDAAQAHGAKDEHGKMAGSLCDAASFSFYPTKNLGALGDGGAVTTSDKKLAEVVRSIGNYGVSSKYKNQYIGVNSRLDELQAVFLIEKLKNLERDNNKRRALAKKYLSLINNDKIHLPAWDGSENHVFHLFVVRVADRKEFCTYLENSGIGYLIHYPIPPHKQKALQELSSLVLPITEKIHDEVVSIPLHIGLEDQEVMHIINVLNQY
ncbi:DegT/DnrJ/EryC1/StrS family aminotransferase [Aquimarina addita]|uniref:DegT/DnrJ/EryC1/StrS family aminotransferase n=1 Tax=Aquimarina addita TaxID=870485 RepID=A0ABP7X972_9FLAO